MRLLLHVFYVWPVFQNIAVGKVGKRLPRMALTATDVLLTIYRVHTYSGRRGGKENGDSHALVSVLLDPVSNGVGSAVAMTDDSIILDSARWCTSHNASGSYARHDSSPGPWPCPGPRKLTGDVSEL